MYEVVKGKVRLVRVDMSGREAVLQVATASDGFAEASLYSFTYQCDGVATTEAVVRPHPRRSWLGADPGKLFITILE